MTGWRRSAAAPRERDLDPDGRPSATIAGFQRRRGADDPDALGRGRSRTASLLLGAALAAALPGLGQPAAGPGPETPGRIWLSPNVQPLPADPAARAPAVRLGDLAYGRHFDRHAMPPPSEFLVPLAEPEAHRARLVEERLQLPERGPAVPLGPPALPEGAAPAPPFLRIVPDGRWILVARPFFLPPARELHHRVDVYTEAGAFRGRLDSLPTHALRGTPDVLVAVERIVQSTGYCEGLRWSVRVYDLRTMRVAEFGCPEGRCGDALFRPVDGGEHLLLALETVAEAGPGPRLLHTGLHLLDRRGALLANGVLAGVLPAPGTAGGVALGSCGLPDAVAARSPVALRYLDEVARVPPDAGWRLRFRSPAGVLDYRLSGRWSGGPNALVPQEAPPPGP